MTVHLPIDGEFKKSLRGAERNAAPSGGPIELFLVPASAPRLV